MLAVAGASLVVLLTTCSAPTMPLHLSQAPVAGGVPGGIAPAPAQPVSLQALPTVTPAAQARQPGLLERIVGQAAPDEPPDEPAADPTARPVDPVLGQAIDRYLSDLAAAQLFQGGVLVARDGTVLLSKGYGMADGDTGTANTALTRFRLASLTKQFTAMAVLVLQARGKLGVDDPICQHLDACPDAWRPVTIRHLLNHTSGIVDYTDFMDFEPTEMNPATPQELVARFRDYPLAFPPGELYDYCNSNYVLLGVIIERASGMSYPDFLQEAIFAPLGMRATGYDTSRGQIAEGAVGYTSFTAKSGFLDASTLYAAGGLYSTVEDMWLWAQALGSERLVPLALEQQMFTPAHLGYGFGWKIDRPGDRLRYSHAGNMTGVANFMAHYPEQRVTVIVLSNVEYTDAEGINNYIASMVFGSP
jgi:CubicO group peptidase (beta-lactamase class C family)